MAAAGVAFAVVLIFMQLGFLGSVETTVTRFFEAMNFDLLLRSPKYLHLSDTRAFPLLRLYQAAEVSGVKRTTPIEIGLAQWRSPITGGTRNILVIGVEPEQEPFAMPEIRAKTGCLTDRQSILIDRKSRREFGPQNGRQFSDADIGVGTEINGREVTIVGHFELGTGLTADGCILVNAVGFRRFVPTRGPEELSFGLVRLQDGADADAAARRMREHFRRELPGGEADVEVLTRAEAIRYELNRWIRETSIGIIFQLGVAVSLVVGTAIVYQVLSSDVAAHLRQYATLKAMGYTGPIPLGRRARAGRRAGFSRLPARVGDFRDVVPSDFIPGEYSHRDERRENRRGAGHDAGHVRAVRAGGAEQGLAGRSRGAVLRI